MWKTRLWYHIQRRVFRLQRRIYKASRHGDSTKVYWIQQKLTRSKDACLWAVRQVTTNRGKHTPGVDGVSSLTPEGKESYADKLKLDGHASRIRRKPIPKPGSNERRLLGIPTLKDRAKQALAKLALEPQHEAYFEPNSYGFRPGRRTQDAIEAIWISLAASREDKYVLEADITKCFDCIDHQVLLEKLQTYPAMRKQIKAWLEAGIMEGFQAERHKDYGPNQRGTPQGGVISPLLANIALHGLEDYIKRTVRTKDRSRISVIRYADDFVILHSHRDVIVRCQEAAVEFLRGIGLELNDAKTTLKPASQGFHFLGFMIKKVRRNGRYRTLIVPSKANVQRHSKALRHVIQNNRTASTYVLIEKVRPLVIGWCNYYRYCECNATFEKLNQVTYLKLRAWMWRRSGQGRHKIKEKYMPSGQTYTYEGKPHKDNWVLVGKTKSKCGEPQTRFLPHHSWISSRKHIKVSQDKSPYDGDAIYWIMRTANYVYHSTRLSKLLRRQKGRCPLCNTYFLTTDMNPPEVDHKLPRNAGGRDHYDNLQAVHRDCHRRKTNVELGLRRSHRSGQ